MQVILPFFNNNMRRSITHIEMQNFRTNLDTTLRDLITYLLSTVCVAEIQCHVGPELIVGKL